MAVKLPCFYLLLTVMGLSQAQEQKCIAADSTCDKCIMAGPECAWCNSPTASVHCHTLQGLENAGCPKTDVYNPQGRVQAVKNVSSTDPKFPQKVHLQPQIVSVNLRPGDVQSFILTATMPPDQPITDLNLETSDIPSGINITMSPMNKGNPLHIQVNVDADQCPSRNQNLAGPWSVYITTRHSLWRVKLDIYLECHCNCTREEESPACSGKGVLVCGLCECNSGHVGQHCQTEQYPILYYDDRVCSRTDYEPPCSGRGTCTQGGLCECDKRINSKELYQGKYCECRNFNCPSINRHEVCSGHGRCECGRCRCDDGWTGVNCLCPSEAKCMAANNEVCNGKGVCSCGRCICRVPFMGPTCEDCPTCRGVCTEYSNCVECRAFGTGKLKDRCDRECSHFSLNKVDTNEDLTEHGDNTRHCRMRTRDGCIFSYIYSWTQSEKNITVAMNKQCLTL